MARTRRLAAKAMPRTSRTGIDAGAYRMEKTAHLSRPSFTLIEIAVVLAIVSLIAGLVLPMVGRLPEGLRIDDCIGKIEAAFRDAALRSRATGATVRVVLDVEGKQFKLEEVSAPPLPQVTVTPAATSMFSTSSARPDPTDVASPEAAPEGRYAGGKTYVFPNGIEWRLEQWDSELDGTPAYTFYPNGEAAGPYLEFTTGDRRFSVDVDRLTGRPAVTESEK